MLSTDLAIALSCSEDQVLIQDIYNGKTQTHVNLCFVSNWIHQPDRSAHAIAIKLMTDIHRIGSDTRSLLPSVSSVHWIPDRTRTGLTQQFRSAHTETTNRTQLSLFDTERAGWAGVPTSAPSPCRKAYGGGILKNSSEEPSNITAEQKGKGKRWDLVFKPRVHIVLEDKRAEANRIFDSLDVDGDGSLTGAEIFMGMMRNGFAEDEIASRLPRMVQQSGPLSREDFVNAWMKSREVDPSRLFERLDLDGSGALSYAELHAGLIHEGFDSEDICKRLPSVFKNLDADGDGEISKEEFLKRWVMSHESGIASTGLASTSMLGLVKVFGDPTPESVVRAHQAAAALSPLTYLPSLPPALGVSPSQPGQDARTLRDDEAAGVFSGIVEAFGAVGHSILQPLPSHLQDAIVPPPPNSDSRLRRQQPWSPRELLVRALGPPPAPPSPTQTPTSTGWAATWRQRLGGVPDDDDEEAVVGAAPSFSLTLQPLSSLLFSGPSRGQS